MSRVFPQVRHLERVPPPPTHLIFRSTMRPISKPARGREVEIRRGSGNQETHETSQDIAASNYEMRLPASAPTSRITMT